MPNIIFTEKCNLHCQYCFADKIKNINLNITELELNNILNWLSKSYIINPHPIGIIGGEPTLHPNFVNYLKIIERFCNKYNTFCAIYTNGIQNDYLNYLSKSTVILINVNKNNELLKTLNIIKNKQLFNIQNQFKINKITLGCNLYPEEKEYKFFWEIVDKYKIHQIRMAVTSPSLKYRYDIDNYYKLMIPIYQKFCVQAYLRKVKITPDCAQIPKEYLKNTYIPNIFEKPIIEPCKPVIDIDKNLQALRCFGSSKKINCLNFENYDKLYQYFLQQDKINNYKGCAAFYESSILT